MTRFSPAPRPRAVGKRTRTVLGQPAQNARPDDRANCAAADQNRANSLMLPTVPHLGSVPSAHDVNEIAHRCFAPGQMLSEHNQRDALSATDPPNSKRRLA